MSFIGPAIPAHLKSRSESDDDDDAEIENQSGSKPECGKDSKNEKKEDEYYGPALPSTSDSGKDNKDEQEEDEYYGPALPPGFCPEPPQPRVVGPTLPRGFALTADSDGSDSSNDDDNIIIGPVLPKPGEEKSSAAENFERRYKKMKDHIEGLDAPVQPRREEWMLELPPERAKQFGLGPRTFAKRAHESGDRSVWTDTPSDKARKEQEGPKPKLPDLEEVAMAKRDRALEKAMASHQDTNRSKSLMEIHQEKKRKREKDEGVEKARRPFDRDVDLQVNRFDEAQKQAAIRKSRLLDDKFSAGKQKFL